MKKKRTLASPVTPSLNLSRHESTEPIAVPLIDLASRSVSLGQRVRTSPSLGAIFALAAFTILGISQTSLFLDGQTWVIILRDASYTSIVACFEGLVMISGGLDLSVGSSFLAGAMVAGALSGRHGDAIVILGVIGVGAGIGLINGLLISYFKLSSIIVTLATMFAVAAVVTTVSGGEPIGPLPNRFTIIGEASWGPIPIVVIYAAIIGLGAHILLEYTTFGTRIRSTGGNKEASRALGLNPRRVSIIVYSMCGLFAALAGLLQAANLGAADPTYGSDLELQAIAAVVIGGTSIYGAIGTMPGAVFGALLLSVLATGLILLHVNGTMQDFVVGIIIILAAGFDQFRKSRMFKSSARQRVRT